MKQKIGSKVHPKWKKHFSGAAVFLNIFSQINVFQKSNTQKKSQKKNQLEKVVQIKHFKFNQNESKYFKIN